MQLAPDREGPDLVCLEGDSPGLVRLELQFDVEGIDRESLSDRRLFRDAQRDLHSFRNDQAVGGIHDVEGTDILDGHTLDGRLLDRRVEGLNDDIVRELLRFASARRSARREDQDKQGEYPRDQPLK